MNEYDKIIIGAGLYGLHAAAHCGGKGEKVLVLEYEGGPFTRATYVNQARIHNGYHYPRSYSTAVKSSGYFNRFNQDFAFCMNRSFRKVYAISKHFSWTDAEQFEKFCQASDVKCERIDHRAYFQANRCDAVFETLEYGYDAAALRDYYMDELSGCERVECLYGARIQSIEKDEQEQKYIVHLASGASYQTGYLLNATYASINQILALLGLEPFKIKYELCEIILCEVSDNIKDVGITVMDGPFFSLMPFGNTGLHSLTSVTFTPHMTSYDSVPTFQCQQQNDIGCSPSQLGNCNLCSARPRSAWPYMYALAKKYLKEDIEIKHVESLFSMKPILMASEIDDSRPTVIRRFSDEPCFISVLSGKINTVYDLEDVL